MLTDILTAEREASLGRGGMEPHVDGRLTHIRVDRNKNRPGVLDSLTGLPLRRRHGRIMILVPHRFFIGVNDADENAIVFLERWRVRRYVEPIGDIDRAAQRRLFAAERN